MPLLPLLAHSTHPCHPTHQRRGTCSARSLGSAACTTSSLSAGSVRSHSQSSSSSPSPAVARLVTPKESALAASSLACRSRSVRPVPTASGCMAASCAVSSMESLFISARGDAQGDPYVWRGELRTHVAKGRRGPFPFSPWCEEIIGLSPEAQCEGIRAPARRAGGYATDVNVAAIMAAAPPHRHANCHTVTVTIREAASPTAVPIGGVLAVRVAVATLLPRCHPPRCRRPSPVTSRVGVAQTRRTGS